MESITHPTWRNAELSWQRHNTQNVTDYDIPQCPFRYARRGSKKRREMEDSVVQLTLASSRRSRVSDFATHQQTPRGMSYCPPSLARRHCNAIHHPLYNKALIPLLPRIMAHHHSQRRDNANRVNNKMDSREKPSGDLTSMLIYNPSPYRSSCFFSLLISQPTYILVYKPAQTHNATLRFVLRVIRFATR